MEKTINHELKRGELVEMVRRMDVGDVYRFPLTKMESVRNVAYNRLLVEKSEGARWTVCANLENKSAVIERVS